MKSLAISLALLTTSVMGGASAAHAQDKVAKTSDWADSASDCMTIVSHSGESDNANAQPGALGWTKATMKRKNGEKVDDLSIDFYGKSGTAIMMLLPQGNAPNELCILTGRIKDQHSFDKTIGLLSEKFDSQPTKLNEKSSDIYYFPEGYVISLSLTGKKNAPAMRLAIMKRNG